MAKTPQQDAVVSDDDLFKFYLTTLPPFLAVETTVRDGDGQPLRQPTACDVATCGKSKIYGWIKEGKVRTKLVDGKRKVETFSLLQYLFNSPEDKPTQLKHAPLAGKQYRRVRRAVQHEQVADRV
jgi:hypothetical protein